MGAVTTRELAEAAKRITKPDCGSCGDDESLVDDDPTMVDFMEARTLLQRAFIIMSFIADEEITKKVTKRERASMQRLADQIKPYLEGTAEYDVNDPMESY